MVLWPHVAKLIAWKSWAKRIDLATCRKSDMQNQQLFQGLLHFPQKGGVGVTVKYANSHEKTRFDMAKRPSNDLKKWPNGSKTEPNHAVLIESDPKSGQKRPHDFGRDSGPTSNRDRFSAVALRDVNERLWGSANAAGF